MIVSLLALLFVVLIIVLICKGCSGRTDALAGKWDFDGTTAYEFDGKGSWNDGAAIRFLRLQV